MSFADTRNRGGLRPASAMGSPAPRASPAAGRAAREHEAASPDSKADIVLTKDPSLLDRYRPFGFDREIPVKARRLGGRGGAAARRGGGTPKK